MLPPLVTNVMPAKGKSSVAPLAGLVWVAAPSCPRSPTRSLAV